MLGYVSRCALILTIAISPLCADDVQPTTADPNSAKVRESLNKALAMFKVLEDAEAKHEEGDDVIEQLRFEREDQAEPQHKARTLMAIATAQSLSGDTAGAKTTLEKVAVIGESIREPEDRTRSFVELAEALIQIGDKAGASEFLRQASRASVGIKLEGRYAASRANDDEGNPNLERVRLIGRIAAAQRLTGEAETARNTLSAAVVQACSLATPRQQVKLLLELVNQASQDEAEPIWEKAVAQAQSVNDVLDKSEVLSEIVRARIKKGLGTQALDLVASRLEGDVQAFLLMEAAEAMANLDNGAPKEWLDRLFSLVEIAQFDSYPKKSKTYSLVAKAQARAGDDAGSEKTVGCLDTTNSIRHVRYLNARVDVLTELARTRLREGNKDAALVTLTVARDIVEPFQGDDGGQSFSISEIAVLMARAGSVTAAREILEKTQGASFHARTYAAIATIQSEAGDPEGAKASLATAIAAAAKIPIEYLWENGTRFLRMIPDLTCGVLGEVAESQLRCHDSDGAMKTMLQMKSIGDGATGMMANQEIRKIARVRIETGDFVGARATLKLCDGDDFDFSSEENQKILAASALAQAKSGAIDETLAWIEKLESPRVKLLALAGYGQGVAEWLSKK